MAWEETSRVAVTVVGAFGGAGAIVVGLSSWLGKLWADRLMVATKQKYEKDIEAYKNQLEMLKTASLRYSGKQFDLYSDLWHALCDLKSAGDRLWEQASESNLKDFSLQLKSAADQVERSSLFIEDRHYVSLSRLLTEFDEYEFGKERLILRKVRGAPQEHIPDYDVMDMIDGNSERKGNYERLMIEIRDDLKRQLKGIGD